MFSVVQVRDNGISFFDVTANVTLESVVVTDTTRDGITLMPTLHKNQLTTNHIMYPTFWICDITTDMFIKHGEEYKFFPTRATGWKGCIRRFETEERYSIKVTMKAETSNYYGVLTADFYEGPDVDIARRISRFTTYKKDRGAQVGGI